jgi:hypothetical protein
MPAQIIGLNGTTAALPANGFPVVQYKTDGSVVERAFVSEQFLAVNIPQFTAALAANTAIFAIRNSTVRKMVLLTMDVTLAFSGTAAASTMQLSARRFTTATPTGGTALTTLVVAEDSTLPTTQILDARCATAAAGLTTTGIVLGNPIFPAIVPRSVTGAVFNFQMDRDVIVNINEGFLVQYDTVGVIGDAISVTCYWGEM